jgi:hypothetical protein
MARVNGRISARTGLPQPDEASMQVHGDAVQPANARCDRRARNLAILVNAIAWILIVAMIGWLFW